jgi:hypothetical protein
MEDEVIDLKTEMAEQDRQHTMQMKKLVETQLEDNKVP